METTGRKWVFGIGLYLIIKGALNLILGFSMSNLVMLIVSVVALVLMLNRVPYINYIVAVFLALMFLMHVGSNISTVSCTHLAGKLREIRALLAPFGLDAVSQKEAGFDAEVEETGTTFAENAALKAHAVHEALHCAVIADDSGLLVDALDGAPGVYSHRFAGENATDAQRCEKLLELLKDTPAEKRTARFQCVLCYVNAAGRCV